MRFKKIKDEYKQEYYECMKENFRGIMEDPELYDDFIENISHKNKKIFEQVLITQTADEFILCRSTYDMLNSKSWKITESLRGTKQKIVKLLNKIR